MIAFSRQRLRTLSRDRSFLIKASIFIIAGSMLLSALTWPLGGYWSLSRSHVDELNDHTNPEHLHKKLKHAQYIISAEGNESRWDFNPPWEEAPNPLPTKLDDTREKAAAVRAACKIWISAFDLQAQEIETFEAYVLARYGDTLVQRDQAQDQLAGFAAEKSRLFANECFADVLGIQQEHDLAINHYEYELERRESQEARHEIIDHLKTLKDTSRLKQVLADPGYHDISPFVRRDANIALKNHLGIFIGILSTQFAQVDLVYLGLAIFAGLIWFIIIGQFSGFRRDQLILYFVALLLGVFSTVLTVFILTLQENVYGFLKESEEVIPGFIYYISGVGLREEVAKLLCFLPLVPFLLKRGNEMEVLIVAGFVGLGFAIEENLSYFARSEGSSTIGRFLTANFLHLSLTALLGLAAVRFFRYPSRRWEEFVGTFLIVVIAHGLYNAVISFVDGGGFFTIVIYTLIAYRFFNVANSLPLSGTFQVFTTWRLCHWNGPPHRRIPGRRLFWQIASPPSATFPHPVRWPGSHHLHLYQSISQRVDLQNQHAIAITVEPIPCLNRLRIGLHHEIPTRKRAH